MQVAILRKLFGSKAPAPIDARALGPKLEDHDDHFVKMCVCDRLLGTCGCARADKRWERVDPCACKVRGHGH